MYRLPPMPSSSIPVIDFVQVSESPEAAAQGLLQACTDWGFFYVKNHPLAQSHVNNIFELEKQFFAQTDQVKLQAPYKPEYNAGFKPTNSHSSAESKKKPDPREAFSINKWIDEDAAEAASLPPILCENRTVIKKFQEELHSFALRLLECISVALDLPKTQFTSQHNRDLPNFDNFELMHYPALFSKSAEEMPIHRISPHTDWGSITLLFQQDIGGLQVRPPRYASQNILPDEVWTNAPVFNDMVLISIGDMMEFWTAGKLKSTWHRVTSNTVSNPEHGRTDRYCFAYFLHPNKDAVLMPIESLKSERNWQNRYGGTRRSAEEHIRARIVSIHGTRDELANGGATAVETYQTGVVRANDSWPHF